MTNYFNFKTAAWEQDKPIQKGEKVTSKHGHTFKVFEQKSPTNKPFLIIETYPTSEGLRSRVCGERFKTLDEAQARADAWEANS